MPNRFRLSVKIPPPGVSQVVQTLFATFMGCVLFNITPFGENVDEDSRFFTAETVKDGKNVTLFLKKGRDPDLHEKELRTCEFLRTFPCVENAIMECKGETIIFSRGADGDMVDLGKFMVFERVDMDVANWIMQFTDQLPPLRDVLFIIIQLITNVVNLHATGYTHGDLKPENMLIRVHEQELQIVLADLEGSMNMKSHTSVLTGTPAYNYLMWGNTDKTERCRAVEIDYAQLAMTIFALLFGCLPSSDHVENGLRVDPTSSTLGVDIWVKLQKFIKLSNQRGFRKYNDVDTIKIRCRIVNELVVPLVQGELIPEDLLNNILEMMETLFS